MESETTKNNSSFELLNNLSFCVFDLETTGGNHTSDKIIEIGLVKIINLKIVDEKSFLINPEIKIPGFIQKLTSIQTKDVANSPRIEDVISEILSFMEGTILVAHNISFDIPFFNSVLKKLNKPKLTNKTICTNLMTKYLIPNLMNSNLNYMSKIFKIPHEKAHRALDDASATANLLLYYLNIFIEKNITKINHLYYPRNRYELDRVDIRKSNKNFEDYLRKIKTPFLISVKGDKGVILFALPCNNTPTEIEYILQKMNSFEWRSITVKIFGTFINALINFNSFFNKLNIDTRNDILEFIRKEHPFSEFSNNSTKTIDFIIINHLAPEQYIIYPLISLHPNSPLVFRYPGHKKKLFQYIKSKANRIEKNKIKIGAVNPHLKQFINSHIFYLIESNKEIFAFSKETPIKQTNEFFDLLDSFTEDNPNSSNFPREHI